MLNILFFGFIDICWFLVVLVLKPLVHGVVSVVLVFVYFFWVGEVIGFLPVWLLFGFVVGVGVDLDHVFLALLFNWEVAVKDIFSLNPFNLYRDFMNGNITGKKLDVNQFIVYSSFHLITMITVNLLVNLYFPIFIVLSIVVTGAHYLMDHITLIIYD